MKEKLKRLVEVNDQGPGKVFALSVQVLIFISLITFTIETLPDLSPAAKQTLHIIEVCSIILFTIEYLLRVYVASSKPGFIFSFYGIIDLLAILPFYLSLGMDLRSLRILRFIRVFRIFKLARYTRAMDHFKTAFKAIKEELMIFMIFAFMTLYLSAVGIYYFEHEAQPEHFKSVLHAMWWSVCTLTTVGYGDVYPITNGGKVFTFFMLIIGIGIIAIPTGLFASSLSTSVKDTKK